MAFTVDDAIQYDCTTPWDIGTVTVPGHVVDFTPENTDPLTITIEHGKLFMGGATGPDTLYRYTLGGPLDPNDYTNKPTRGTTQCGNEVATGLLVAAQCGEEPPDQKSLDSAVCNNFLANEVWYLWNDTLTNNAPPAVPDDLVYWPHFWYVGGTPFGTALTVTPGDRKRFEKICLKNGPTEQWIVTMIDVPALIGPYDYDSGLGGTPRQIRFDSTVLGSITSCRLAQFDDNLVDHETELAALESGDWLRMAITADGTQYIDMVLDGAVTDSGSYFTIPVATPVASPAWTGFPSDETPTKVYLRYV
jgi:hypothetical protein